MQCAFGGAMTKVLSPGKPSITPAAPAAAPETPTVDAAKQQQQEQDQIDRKRGRAATILTSANGDTTKPKLGASAALGY